VVVKMRRLKRCAVLLVYTNKMCVRYFYPILSLKHIISCNAIRACQDSSRSETCSASHPRKSDSADLQLFEDENRIVFDTSFAGNKSLKAPPQPACDDVLPEPRVVGSLLIKPAGMFLEATQTLG